MALQDFIGVYKVKTTAGTDFGFGTTVTITSAGEDQASVAFQIAMAQQPRVVPMRYDAVADALVATDPEEGVQLMAISRFLDPKGTGWESIYGVFVYSAQEGQRSHLPVWTATPVSEVSSETPLAADVFLGTYRIKTTADAQFGIGSKVTISKQAGGSMGIEIVNPMGKTVVCTTLTYDSETHSVYGFESPSVGGSVNSELLPITIALSLAASDTGKKVVYGTLIVGDPQQGGTYAGEEEDP